MEYLDGLATQAPWLPRVLLFPIWAGALAAYVTGTVTGRPGIQIGAFIVYLPTMMVWATSLPPTRRTAQPVEDRRVGYGRPRQLDT